MAKGTLSELVGSATKHPLVLAGGVAGVGLLAVLATVKGQANTPESTAEPTTDPSADPLMGGDASAYGDPSASGSFGAPGYNPFGQLDTSIYPTADPAGTGGGMTADGCSWPPPAVPPELVGKGSWQCSSSSWVWNWIDPQGSTGGDTTKGGCPLPKPTLPPALIGAYKYACVSGHWKLVPLIKPPAPPVPSPTPAPAPRPNVSTGRHVAYAGHVNTRGKLILTTRSVFTLQHAQHFTLGPAVNGDTSPGKRGGYVKVRKIKAANRAHAALVGHYLKV